MTKALLTTTCAHQLFSLSLHGEQNAPEKLRLCMNDVR